MTSMAHLHPKTPEKSAEGGRITAAFRSQDEYIQYCEDCLSGINNICQHGLRRCVEKQLWHGYLASVEKPAVLEVAT